ncbi:MAG: hypothetical protein QM391_03605 [Bacillota bacterium]|jgi:Zn finger protein HypA/HybF involved in hydrogenase expression|nr:hypothetical protein [Bacillota bacterium]NLD12617.1 hypothetical protein [Bacillota bacterium]HAV20643.1 hypothetical protein [Bacillota bacterium]HOB88689.1 hypothetical protein [Bacillota bacterium]HOJ57242.1 hypothetical protein [Bacillota bacterium]
MKKSECGKARECGNTPEMPDNAEPSVKCKQCGGMISVSDMSLEGTECCPVCGSQVSSWDTLKSEVSNEGY